jgi:hypothetical protein
MPSPREDVADHLVETCAFGGLNDSYGIMKSKATDKKGKTYWNVTFCKARYLDGVIKVYSERFILVKWKTAYRSMAPEGQEVFKSEDAARDFIVKSFVNL